jgi:hypothetical protein
LKKKYLTTQELYDLYLDIEEKKGRPMNPQEVKKWIKNKEQFSWIEKGNEQFRRWVKNNKEKLKIGLRVMRGQMMRNLRNGKKLRIGLEAGGNI